MGHSITINGKDLFGEYSLVPQIRPVVNEPDSEQVYVDIHGTDGPLDLSEALTGYPTYKSRTGTWKFHIKNYRLKWDVILQKLANALHGKRVKAILEDDPYYYYMGRVEVDKLSSAPNITLKYTLEPYKYEPSSLEDWLWDPFNFETGIVREYAGLTVSGSLTLTIPGSARPCIPTIICSDAMTVDFAGTTYTLAAGSNRVPDIVIGSDGAELAFTGSGTVSVDYKGGWL